MKKLLIVLIIFLLMGCQTVMTLKTDLVGRVYVYSIHTTVDMKGKLPENIIVQFHAELEVTFKKNNICTVRNINFTTVNNNVADRIINQLDFGYRIEKQRVYLTDDFYFEFGENCLIYDTGEGVIKLQASGNIYHE